MEIYCTRRMEAWIADTEKSSIFMQWLCELIKMPSPLPSNDHHNSWDTVRNGIGSTLKWLKESSDRELIRSQVVSWAGSRAVQWGAAVSGGVNEWATEFTVNYTRSWLDLVIWTEWFLRTSLYVVCSQPTPDWRRWCRWSLPPSHGCAQCCAKQQNKPWTWVYTKMADVPVPGFWKYWTQKLALLKSECHAIMNKYREAASVVQQVYKVLSDIENLARCTPAKVGESSEWTSIVNRMEKNRANFCKGLDGKPLFSTLCNLYTVTLNELKPSWKWVHRQDRVVQWTNP
jgi:hypothetical protein